MKIKKTKYASYCLNDVAQGCKFCVKGEKLVLFISGVCNRECFYCSLSEKRKNKDIVWANERVCKNTKDAIEEIKASRAKGAGITGGDPLLFVERTVKYAKALKQKFGKNFHIHIYLPTKYLTIEKLSMLAKYIDEVRFHPEFLCQNYKKLSKKELEKNIKKDIEKIRLAGLFWNKNDIGVELPLLPDRKQEIFNFILKVKDYIGFVNLNELEISDTNFNYVVKHYKLKEKGYVILNSKEAGLWILKKLEKAKLKLKKRLKFNLKVHLCTAELKNNFQFKNRLKRHEILPFGKRTKEGTVIYLVVKGKLKKFKECYYDKKKKRTILSESLARKLLSDKGKNKRKIFRVEEFPTYDATEVEIEQLQPDRIEVAR